MREVYTYIQLKCYLYPPWKNGALQQSRPLLLALDFSKLFSRTDSNERRPAGGLSTENCFFCSNRTHCTSLFLLFPGLDTNRLQQGRPCLSCSSTYCTSPTSTTTTEMRTNVPSAASLTADDATNSAPNHRSRVSLTAFLRDRTFARHNLRSPIKGLASTPIAPQGSNSELCRTASAAATQCLAC